MKVLLVDDEKALLEQAKIFLEKRNEYFDIDTAVSARKAFDMMENTEYEVIVADYQMPDINGLELLKELREERGSDLPFIMFTGKGREDVAMEALNLGADRYLQKGGDPRSQYGVLADAIEQEIEHSEMSERKDFFEISASKAPESIFVTDKDANIIYVNEQASRSLGYSIEELESMKVYDLDPNFSSENWKEHWDEVLEENRIRIESKHIRKDGEEFPVELLINPIEHRGREYHFTFARDISERKRTEKVLHREKKKFQEIFNNANDAIYLHELTQEGMPGKFIEVNDVACQMLGYSREEFMEMSPGNIDAEERSEEIPEIMEELTERGDIRFEMTHEAKDGTEIPVEIHSVVFELEGKDRVLSIARDISKRKKAEKELKMSEKRFRRSFEASPDPTFLLDGEGYFRDVNESAVDKLKYGKDEIIGKHLSEAPFMSEETIEKTLDRFQRRKSGEDIPTYTIEFITKDGKILYTEINVGTFEEDGFGGEVVIARDITDRKKADEREDMLHSLLRHDVKNKVQVVQGYLQLLEEDENLSEEAEDYVEKAIKGNKENINLMQKIRLLLNTQREQKKPVSIRSTLEDVVEESEPMIKDEGMDIQMECPSEDCKVRAGSLLNKVFSNIIENSVYHSRGSKIMIHGDITEDEVICTIEDDGTGIPDEDREKIFNRGFTTDEERGTGLGLFLVRMLVESYGGSIKVKKSDMGGARFDVVLKKV